MTDELLYTLCEGKLLTPDIGVKSVMWYAGQPDEWESDTTDMDGALLPCVLVRLEPQQRFGTGHTHYAADTVVYFDVVQYPMASTRASDNLAEHRQRDRDMHLLEHLVQKALVRTAQPPLIGMFQKSAMMRDHNYSKLRVTTIAFRTLLKYDIDPRTYQPATPPISIIPTINAPVVHGDFSNRHFNADFFNA